ncbi:10852_t:CDS:2 [Ambispora gerdemannii]|uniref:10852_t:CDS:1 n=1 Tax=Ambispora gerdemannii TaxID=144530 RepID=A0A9N8VPR7_9GLOM|nr:10852_t:CDS:2 [Ambispora gerdemannii]
MKKNIGKLKQWTNEKLGSSQKTETTDEFQDLQQKTDMRHNGFDKLHFATDTYIKTISKKKDSIEEKTKTLPIETLGSTMRVYGEEIGTDSPYGLALVRFGIANEKVANAQLEYVTRVREEFLEGLEFTINDLRQYQSLKRKLESRRLDYDAKLSKVQKSKKEKPELEEEMRAAKQKYEETIEDMSDKMTAVHESEGQYVQELTAFLDAELEFFKKGHEILSAVRKDWIESESKFVVRRTPARKNTQDSDRSRSDIEEEEKKSDNDSIRSSNSTRDFRKGKKVSSPSRSASSKLPAQSKPDRSDNLAIPSSKSRAGRTSTSPTPSKSIDIPNKNSASKKFAISSLKKQVRTLYSYQGEGEEELSMEVGDIITVLEEIDEGWWIGEITTADGTLYKGMFPANYTEPVLVESPPRKPSPPSRNNSSKSVPTRPQSQRSSSENTSRRSQSTPLSANIPPVPSRNSKPPPPSRNSSSSRPPPPRPGGFKSNESSALGNNSRNSYIPQDYFEKDTPTANVAACAECGCNDYSPNVFKKGSCNNCFHKH